MPRDTNCLVLFQPHWGLNGHAPLFLPSPKPSTNTLSSQRQGVMRVERDWQEPGGWRRAWGDPGQERS